MTQYLPPNLLALFAARDPLPFLLPADKLPHEKKRAPFLGVSAFTDGFEDPKDTPPPTRVETRDERKERKRKERQEQHAYKLEQDLALWDPASNSEATSDPFKSLYVARINYDSSESKLRREFEVFGTIKKICLINDRNSGKPRGYAFIEYEHERDMHSAYKHADGKKIDGRRVLVDVERGRTVKGWRPRRLGGGLGGTRKGGPDENTRFSGRDEFGPGNADRRDFRDEDRVPVMSRGGGGGGGGRDRERERSRSRERDRERRRRSRSKEGVRSRRSRSRERRRSRSRERRRSREKMERPDKDIEIPEAPEEEDVKEIRKEKKRSRRSRSKDRRRSRSKDKKRSRRSRSKERKCKIKEEGPGLLAAGGYVSQNMPVNSNGDNAYNVDEFGNVRVKEEKMDAYAGYGGDNGAGPGGPGMAPPPPQDGGDIEEGEEVE